MNLNKLEIGDVCFRHGDVLLKRSDKSASGKFVTKKLLHLGQNHHHNLSGGSFRISESDNIKLLEVKKKTKLTHEEHKAIEIPPGKYLVDIQKEYDHWLEEARKVID